MTIRTPPRLEQSGVLAVPTPDSLFKESRDLKGD